MRLVILESPYAAFLDRTVEDNILYTRSCVRDSLLRDESPLCSHLLYTQHGILDDLNPKERTLGISAGLAWGEFADASVIYVDYGITKGMREGIARAQKEGRPIEFRILFD